MSNAAEVPANNPDEEAPESRGSVWTRTIPHETTVKFNVIFYGLAFVASWLYNIFSDDFSTGWPVVTGGVLVFSLAMLRSIKRKQARAGTTASPPPMPYAEIEHAVLSALKDIAGPERPVRHMDPLLDVIDGDEFSFDFVPDLEKRLGVRTTQKEWDRVLTVQHAIDVFANAVRRQPRQPNSTDSQECPRDRYALGSPVRFFAGLLGTMALGAAVFSVVWNDRSSAWQTANCVACAAFLLYGAVTGRSPEWMWNQDR
jgi:hypothetical protein